MNLSMQHLPRIIDNHRSVLFDAFQQVAPQHEHLSIATGYWDLPGTQMVFDYIKNYKKIRLLIGREPLIPRHQQHQPEPDYPDKDFFDDLERMQPSPELKELVGSIKELIAKGVLEVRVYRRSFLHAKCYIFGDYSTDNAIGIIGSSNFTRNGLTANTELNALESDHRIVAFQPQTEKQEVGHLFWFDQFWNDPETELWNGAFTEILGTSPVGDTLFDPYETYIKTLHDLYRDELIEEELDASQKGQHALHDFQSKNVQALLRRLKKYKVAMLADSVGLGKTYTAIEVIKQYLKDEGARRRVEIICPKSLKTQWQKELATQGVPNYSPVTLQNPQEIEDKRKLDDIASVSLFVIDESHNLKNRGGTRFSQIIDWIRNNPQADVLLLTATPINNQLSDIVNQILLGTRGRADILKVTVVDKKLKQTVQMDFYQTIENLKKKINKDITEGKDIDYDHIKQTMMPILRAFVVRRTRQGIEREYGGLTIDGEQRYFPKVSPEVKKYGFKKEVADEIKNLVSGSPSVDLSHIYRLAPQDIVEHTRALLHPLDQIQGMPLSLSDMDFKDTSAVYFIYQIILLLGFVPYRWQMYQTRYYGKTREEVKVMKIQGADSKTLFLQLSIYGVLRTMFLKRMESSISAVRTSLDTYKRKLTIFETGLSLGKIVSLKDMSNIEEQLGIGDSDFDPEELVLDEETELDTVDDKKYALAQLRGDIKKERDLIEVLDKQLAILEKDDSKIKAFADLLNDLQHRKPAGSKVLVFSFYADTVEYLKEKLPTYASCITPQNAAFISSKNRADSESLAARFAPIAKKHKLQPGEEELNYLFSTDILSEGQNLQDCGILVNYDLHWNPVRMIQRNGRVNRLGGQHNRVFIYNISPEAKLEEYLQLVGRLEGKINLIRNTIGTDSPVLDEQENPMEFTDSLKDIYSEDMQKRIEAMNKAEREADFLLSEDEFVDDLKAFHLNPEIDQAYKERVYKIPFGKWALMPSTEHRGDQRPEILVLNGLCDAATKEIVAYSFTSLLRDGNSFQAVTQLQALEWLRTRSEGHSRSADRISVDKAAIANIAQQRAKAYLEGAELATPLPTQLELLRIMHDSRFAEEDIQCVLVAFQGNNVLDRQEIAKLMRRALKRKKENRACLEDLQTIVRISRKALASSAVSRQLGDTSQVLFYVKDNA